MVIIYNPGLTVNEKLELERLRQEISKYRDMEHHNEKDHHSASEESDDEDDTIDDEKVQHSINKAKVRMSMPRTAVSSEVYGHFNKKENWIARHIQKNEDQIQRIKVRILQSFLFAGLESNDLNIVIGAMEEKSFKYYLLIQSWRDYY
jgi:cAMP-dependent protein kinase regulator